MPNLQFIHGLVIDFELIGYMITGERKSLDGTKTFCHVQNLTDEQFNSAMDGNFTIYSDENHETIMNTAEWSDES